jgi:hypothetical protein
MKRRGEMTCERLPSGETPEKAPTNAIPSGTPEKTPPTHSRSDDPPTQTAPPGRTEGRRLNQPRGMWRGYFFFLCALLCDVGQGTFVEVLVAEPSSNVNEAENGKPPRGQCSGTPMPSGLKCTSLPCTFFS